MTQPQLAPPTVPEPVALALPSVEETPPESPQADSRPTIAPEPDEPDVSTPDPAPQPIVPVPEPEIADTLPQPPAPEPVPEVEAPDIAARPVPRPAPRVAPEAVPEPLPEAEIAPEVQDTVVQSETAEPSEAEEQQATAPEAATTEIVTEAEEPARAPTSSMRPRARPNRPVVASEAPAEPEDPAQTAPAETAAAEVEDTAVEDKASAIAGALEEALAGATAQAPSGPPLTQGERDGFRIAVQDCWVVDVGSQAANVTVTIGFDMDRSGRVVGSSLQMLAAEGGDARAVETAFQSARRAILRCQGDGYNLPVDKFDQWKSVEMTFNPESMRIR